MNVLSGGESQRLKLVGHLAESKKKRRHALLIFDEPTTGLHFDDIAALLNLFQQLVERGDTLIVIEHNLEVIQSADYIIDLGPEAGVNGGAIVAEGTPEQLANEPRSQTGIFLREKLACTRIAIERHGSPRFQKRSSKPAITVHGGRHHNLKNLSLSLPHEKLIVITGLSGSGKSSLAFDILFAEGQRRFLDSMSTYARQFVEQLERPDVDHVEGHTAERGDRAATHSGRRQIHCRNIDRGLSFPAAALRQTRNPILSTVRHPGDQTERCDNFQTSAGHQSPKRLRR